jgi:DNA-directed RNA polymerase subunit RPC12/RpoP
VGSILRSTCPCGFKIEPLLVGCGYLDHNGTFRAPAYCVRCKKIVVSDYQKKKRCRTCGTPLIFYNDPALQTDTDRNQKISPVFIERIGNSATEFVLPDIPYLCPACGKKTMTFTDVGCWD